MEHEPWVSERKRIEMDNADRIKYFDAFIDMVLDGQVELEQAIQGYKETLEHQGIPLVPAEM
jgi:hypothetical protein